MVKENLHKYLPKEIIVFKNEDKKNHEKWTPRRDLLNFPAPTRFCISAIPNSGKTNLIKNILVKADPPYEEIYLIHPDPEYTKEYDDVNAIKLDHIPPPDFWEGKKKTFVVIDDYEFSKMSKEEHRNLSRLVGYCSTHKFLSVACVSQDLFSLPVCVRRCCNVFIFWKIKDTDSAVNVARKSGLKKEDFFELFAMLKTSYDFIIIDTTKDSPAYLRKNGYEIIQKN